MGVGGMTTDVRVTAERSGWVGEPQPTTVARVDLRPGSSMDGDGSHTGAAHEMALRSIQQTVRGDDRVCPYGLSRIAIAFGSDAVAVTPRMLGERLARAVGQGVTGDRRAGRQSRDETTRGPHPTGEGPSFHVNGNGSSKAGPRLATVPSTMVVTVDRLLTEDSGQSGVAAGALISSFDGIEYRHGRPLPPARLGPGPAAPDRGALLHLPTGRLRYPPR